MDSSPTQGALFVMHLPCTLDSCKIPFNLELGVFGGLITPVCSYILSEGFSVLSKARLHDTTNPD